MTLKELRKTKKLTQEQAANLIGVSRKTYIVYENDESKLVGLKKECAYNALNSYGYIDETHGVLTIEQIREICSNIFKEFDVKYCYLFGSYAKNKATPTSDVDLLVSVPVDGLMFFDLVETLRERLRKKVDLLDFAQLKNNEVLLDNILRDGIKIYG